MQTYRRFGAQTLHYFTRAAVGVPDRQLDTPAAWNGSDMAAHPERWMVELTVEQIDEIGRAADQLVATSVPLEEVSSDEFNLPTVGALTQEWKHALASGTGVVCVRGLPVREWGDDKSAYAYWGLGHHLGVPGAQNPANELLGHVKDYREAGSAPMARMYRTAEEIAFHCDTADVVGLLCLRTARSGGQSRIASSVHVFNELLQRSAELAADLFEPFELDRRDEQAPGDPPTVRIPPAAWDGNVLRTFWHSDYMRSAARHDGIELGERRLATMDTYDEIANDDDTHLDMWLKEGDIQFISNHTVIHARTGYEDHDDPNERRHLLRLWLSLD
ncbi:MAG: TauD/TfdA family dioxygenase [Ilumatobacteraceae bacterium]